MGTSTKASWWITPPGALLDEQDGGLLSGSAAMVTGVLLMAYAFATALNVLMEPREPGAMLTFSFLSAAFGVPLILWGERYGARWFHDSRRTSVARMTLVVQLASRVSVLAALGAASVAWLGPLASQSPGKVIDAAVQAAIVALPLTLAIGALGVRRLLAVTSQTWRRLAAAGVAVAGLLLLLDLGLAAYARHRDHSLYLLSQIETFTPWMIVGAGLALSMAVSARKQLSIWDGPERWRDATLTPDLRLVFADAAGARPASSHFVGYSGPVVVIPTAGEAGAVFRGDGAPTDGWVVPGTRASLDEAVRCARVMAWLTVATVAVVAVAPLAMLLASLFV